MRENVKTERAGTVKKFCCLLLAAALLLTLGACGKKETQPTMVYVDEGTQETEEKPVRDTAILYTAGTAARDPSFFAALSTYRDECTYQYLRSYVGLIDLGGALDVTDGEDALYTKLDLMITLGYETAALSPADFRGGADTLLLAANAAQFPILCGNLVVAGTDSVPLSAWTLASYGGLCVAYVGLAAPEDGQTAYRTEDGQSYELADAAASLRTAASAARAAGAQYVIVLASCGAERAAALVKEGTGADAFLDGAGDGGESRTLTDAAGKEVLYSGLDPAQDSVGVLVIGADGTLRAQITMELGEKSGGMLDHLASLGYDVEAAQSAETENVSDGTAESGTGEE